MSKSSMILGAAAVGVGLLAGTAAMANEAPSAPQAAPKVTLQTALQDIKANAPELPGLWRDYVLEKKKADPSVLFVIDGGGGGGPRV